MADVYTAEDDRIQVLWKKIRADLEWMAPLSKELEAYKLDRPTLEAELAALRQEIEEAKKDRLDAVKAHRAQLEDLQLAIARAKDEHAVVVADLGRHRDLYAKYVSDVRELARKRGN